MTTTTNARAASATAFSRKSAPPPPLIERPVFRDFIRAVDRDVDRLVAERHEADTEIATHAFRLPRRGDGAQRGTRADEIAGAFDRVECGRTGAEPDTGAGAHEFVDRAIADRAFRALFVFCAHRPQECRAAGCIPLRCSSRWASSSRYSRSHFCSLESRVTPGSRPRRRSCSSASRPAACCRTPCRSR